MKMTAAELATLLGGVVIGDEKVQVERPAKIEEATPGSLTFLANLKYEKYLYGTEASIVLVQSQFSPSKPVPTTLIKVPDVYRAMATLADQFSQNLGDPTGISAQATVHPSVSFGENVAIGHYVVICKGCKIESGAVIHPFTWLGPNVVIGKDTVLHAGVKVYHECQIGNKVIIHANTVIGSDGFGFVRSENGFKKIKQLGNVVIEDNVDIGANVVIDRASLGSTLIKAGTKLDNLIQVAHNVQIGTNTAIAAQSGIAGSTKIGNDVLIGGQVGIVGHIDLADKTSVQAQSGVTGSTIPGQRLYGSPALDYSKYLRSYALFKNLPGIVAQLNKLEDDLKSVQEKLDQYQSGK